MSPKKSNRTIIGVEPAEKTQNDGPEGLLTTLPDGTLPAPPLVVGGGEIWRSAPQPVVVATRQPGECLYCHSQTSSPDLDYCTLVCANRASEQVAREARGAVPRQCEARDVGRRSNTVRRCERAAVGKITVWTDEGFWVRVHVCEKHKRRT